jgi:hypothetical protein
VNGEGRLWLIVLCLLRFGAFSRRRASVCGGLQPNSRCWPFAPMSRCSRRGADTRVCSVDTHVGVLFEFCSVERSSTLPEGILRLRPGQASCMMPEKFVGGGDGAFSGRFLDTRRIFSGFGVSMNEDTKREKIPCCMSRCTQLDKRHSGADMSVGAADTSVRARPEQRLVGTSGQSQRAD